MHVHPTRFIVLGSSGPSLVNLTSSRFLYPKIMCMNLFAWMLTLKDSTKTKPFYECPRVHNLVVCIWQTQGPAQKVCKSYPLEGDQQFVAKLLKRPYPVM